MARLLYEDIGRPDRFISLPNGARKLEDAAAKLCTPDFGRKLAARQVSARMTARLGPIL